MTRKSNAPLDSSLAAKIQQGADSEYCIDNYSDIEGHLQTDEPNKFLSLITPDDHLSLMVQGLTTNPHGTVLVGWQPLRTPKWYKANLEKAQDQLSRFTNEPDIYLTPNLFHGWRLVRLLKGLSAFYIDIDDHTGKKVDVMKMRYDAEDIILRLGIPEPNFIVYSGRGIHLYWLLDNVPAQALPRWRAVQKVLCAAFNGDIHATDPTRLLRLVGTKHSKTGFKVTGEAFFAKRYDFNWFCDEVLPFSQSEVRDFRAAQARKGEAKGRSKQSQGQKYGSIYQRWYLVYQDLLRIQNHFWFGGMQEPGHREQMLYHTANALSWFTYSDALENEIKATAKIMIPSYRTEEVKSYCSSVISRARRTQSTPDAEFRYKYSRARLWQDFEPIVGNDKELLQSLRAIIPSELRAERQRELEKKRNRVAEGRYKDKRIDVDEQKKQVRKMLSQGLKQKHIAERLGLTQGRVSQIVKTIKKQKKPVIPRPIS